jgi:hypothetical protein
MATVLASTCSTMEPRLIEHLHEVVLRVVERARGHRARVGQRVARLLGEEAQRVAQHLRQVVLHQQRLELVHRQRRVPLGRIEVDAKASLADSRPLYERRELVVQPEACVLQVHRVDGVRRHRHFDPRRQDPVLGVKADHARQPSAGTPVDHPVQIHEAHRFPGAVRVPDARAQTAGNEGEVRVGVAWFDRALRGVQVVAPVHAVVLVACPFGEQVPQRVDITWNVLGTQA